jgi:hypothetical protein
MGKAETWSPVSYDILELAKRLPAVEIVSCKRHDHHYDHSLRKSRISPLGRRLFRVHQFCNAVLRRLGAQSGWPGRATMRLFVWLGAPVDQTEGAALAQIELVARKRA